MNNKLFAFFETVWSYIDTGKFYREPFRWLYAVIAVLNLLFPLYIIFLTIDSGLFKYMSGGNIFACILVFLLLIFLGIMSFHLWSNRQKKVKEYLQEENEFIAIPVVSHFIQTMGEWLGFYIGVGGCLISLLFVLFGVNDSLGGMLGNSVLPMGVGFSMVIMYPIMGFLIVVSGRLIAELYRALAAIANNTKRLEGLAKHTDNMKVSKIDQPQDSPE